MSVWTLQPKRELPRIPKPQLWTGQDFTPESKKALTFRSRDEAQRHLNTHKHLWGLHPVELIPNEPFDDEGPTSPVHFQKGPSR